MSTDAPRFDLQSHSTYSDGSLPPADVVVAAAAAGVELLALTDHDNAEGVREAADAAASSGIQLVTGVEVSARDEEGGRELHILGYAIDDCDPELQRRLAHSRGARERRAAAMQEALTEVGFELDRQLLDERIAAGRSVGRPHIAAAVTAHPANRERLRTEGLADSGAFLEAYLVPGTPAFVRREAPSTGSAIEMIHEAGGVAVWAHPFWDVQDLDEVTGTIDRLVAQGLGGVECFYATHTRSQAELLAEHCHRLGLLSTGSSDFHGPEHPHFSRFRAFDTYGRDPVLGRIAAA